MFRKCNVCLIFFVNISSFFLALCPVYVVVLIVLSLEKPFLLVDDF